jgi:hypothetical protein
MNQSMFAGFAMMLLGALLAVLGPTVCLARLLVQPRPLPIDWYWPSGIAFVFGLVFILTGAVLDFTGALIARWWWGVTLREIYFGSARDKADSN